MVGCERPGQLDSMETIGTWWMWTGFAIFVVLALIVDIVVMEKQGAHKVTMKEAAIWSAIWVAVSMLFAAWFWWYLNGSSGREVANEQTMAFLTGYLIEKSLSVDNIFVFLMIFTYFAIPAEFQKRALVIGIIGAIVLRAVMILIGAWLLAKFHWILYVFGLFLVVTGVKMWLFADNKPDVGNNPLVRWCRKHLPITETLHGDRFTVLIGSQRWFTPLFLVLVAIGITDVIFAVDSIPAIFAVTDDPFIVMTANIFAILGLRALYFLLADMAERFHLLSYGLAVILVFIGVKMLLLDVYKIPVGVALGVVAGVLTLAIVASVMSKPKEDPAATKGAAGDA